VAIELKPIYDEKDSILNYGFVETSIKPYLDYKVAELGIVRKPATKATTNVLITGSLGATINIGDKVSSNILNYVAKETKTITSGTQMTVLVECEVEGSLGNVPVGAIKYFPITLSGLSVATNTEEVTNGYDEETNDALRQRYYEKVRTPATSGNKYHYRNWAKEVVGVGDARVIPLWNGNGTVKIVIIDSNKTGANEELIDSVYEHIEDNRPIGATVTVVSASELSINVTATLIIDLDNYNMSQVISNIENKLREYLESIAFIDGYISHAKIGSIILDSEGVLDYSNLTINGSGGNITIDDSEVAVLGGVSNV
jgi:uncharacterized phage protein gp47/JayE